jgi:IS5 family transposase
MEIAVPWNDLVRVIEPHYPVIKCRGCPPIGIKRVLRNHFLQICFSLSDPAVEEALYDITSMRDFARIDLGREPVPDGLMRRQTVSFATCLKRTI